jgi:hypothetical protein
MIEERKNGGNENGPDDGGPQRSDYGEPQFAPPGPGERLDQATAPPGQPMPGLDEGPGGDVSGAERPAASPRRQAKRGKRKSGAKAKSTGKRAGAKKGGKKRARAGAKKGGKKRASAGRSKASGKRRGSSKKRR